MIVADATVLVKYLLREKGWQSVSYYIRREPIYSIDHVIKEVANSIWKHCSQFKVIDQKRAFEVFYSLIKLIKAGVLILEMEEDYIEKAFSIAIENNLTFYDSLYIALALERRACLMTCDRKQAEVSTKHGLRTIIL
ncbi:MAG: type II toxin-antitoxin system VapC family toxin [Archaeoglobaceae archaeon]|nr:type II toxin-antitoxin system VapC family toxin [Archaeoglobaceae archaeon]MCX8152087.1 type II toxin-antitoxin system VapC family toxin [Archaeoglobaceae archaeon]MDW8013522.1 type II toxin-antitoxin system VapC family toxin [Archaeoglobaceae archaeon]